MIVQILENKGVSQDTSFLCNQYDNESASIKINLPAIFINQTYLYFLICKSPDKTVNQYSVPLLLTADEDLIFIVNSTLSSTKGYWQFCLVIKEASGNLVAVTNYWTGVVKSGIVEEDELAEQVEDSNLKLANEAMLEAEALRVIAENQRDAAELSRISAENGRTLAETDRLITEQNRTETESERDTAETLRVTNENGRALEESLRVTAEQGRATSETNRVNAEAVRAIAEDNRATAETTRETAEVTRKSNETSRQTAEQSRTAAEIARESSESTRIDKETARQQAETIRGTNETNRIAAETNRETAEGLRTTAEQARAGTESLRVTAEQGRASAESDRVTAEESRVNAEVLRVDAEQTRAGFYNGFSAELTEVKTDLESHKSAYTSLNIGNRLTALESSKVKRYGVKFTGSNPIGERLYDAIGMKAPVAVDDQIVDNDFDKVSFYNRPMCNVYFTSTGHPNVMAYRGEPGFNFEGAIFPPYAEKADVYYECTPCGWNGSYDEPTVTGTPTEGFQLFECFPNWNTKIYLPTFWMAYVDGKPTSRSGVRPGYYSLNSAMSEAKTWNVNAHTETMAAHMYEYVLQIVEFATRDLQNVMMGCSNMRYNSATDTAMIAEIAVNRIILSNSVASNYVAGQTIVIGTSQNGDNVAKERSVTSIEDYDGNNKAVYFDGTPVNIAIGNFVSSRVWKNGATDIVIASSGSPVSNTSGKYPCIWRGKVDSWGEGFSVICDILIIRNGVGTGESPYTYRPHFLADPRKYANGVITDDYIELQYDLPQTDGYAKLLGQDSRFKHIGLTKELGAASTTWLSAYYYYPRYEVCVVFVGGFFTNGRLCSPVFFYCYHPSNSSVDRLARLFVIRV